MLKQKFKAARFLFVLGVFVFFLNFFFVGGNFFYDFFLKTMSFSYIMLLFTFLNYMYYLIKINFIEKLQDKEYVFYILIGFLVLIFIL